MHASGPVTRGGGDEDGKQGARNDGDTREEGQVLGQRRRDSG